MWVWAGVFLKSKGGQRRDVGGRPLFSVDLIARLVRNEAMAAVNRALVGCHPSQGFVVENKETAVVWWGMGKALILPDRWWEEVQVQVRVVRSSELAQPRLKCEKVRVRMARAAAPRTRLQSKICDGGGSGGCNDLQ